MNKKNERPRTYKSVNHAKIEKWRNSSKRIKKKKKRQAGTRGEPEILETVVSVQAVYEAVITARKG